MKIMAEVVQIIHGDSEFDEASNAAKVVIFDFSAVWCGPCRALGPILDEIASEATEDVKVFKVDVDENENLARKFRITAVPAVAIFKDGTMQGQLHVGLRAKSYYTEKIDALLNES